MDNNYLTDLFINEAKAALDSKGGAVVIRNRELTDKSIVAYGQIYDICERL